MRPADGSVPGLNGAGHTNASPHLVVAPDAPRSADTFNTPAELAARMKVSRSFIYAELKAGRLKATYFGRLPRISEADFLAYVEARR